MAAKGKQRNEQPEQTKPNDSSNNSNRNATQRNARQANNIIKYLLLTSGR